MTKVNRRVDFYHISIFNIYLSIGQLTDRVAFTMSLLLAFTQAGESIPCECCKIVDAIVDREGPMGQSFSKYKTLETDIKINYHNHRR